MKAKTGDNLPCMKSKHIGVTAGIEPTQIHVHIFLFLIAQNDTNFCLYLGTISGKYYDSLALAGWNILASQKIQFIVLMTQNLA